MSERGKSILPFIRDALDSIEKIEKYIHNVSYEHFIDDEKTRDAVVRNLEIIGEAAKNIPGNVKERFSDIAWKSMTGMRNKLTHEYFGISFPVVWETINSDLPVLKEKMENLFDIIEKEEAEQEQNKDKKKTENDSI